VRQLRTRQRTHITVLRLKTDGAITLQRPAAPESVLGLPRARRMTQPKEHGRA